MEIENAIKGLEGVKVLSSGMTENSTEAGCILLIFLAITLIIIGFLALFDGETWALMILAIGIPLCIVSVVFGFITDDYRRIECEITPIEDKYYIDLNQWEITDTDQEIITIQTVKQIKDIR